MRKKKEEYDKSVLFKKTLPYILKERSLVIITFLFAIGVAVLTTITPFLTKDIIDIYIPENNLKQIFLNLLWYFIATIVVVLMRYALQYLQTLTGMHIEKNIREEAIEKINYLPVDYYSLEPDGKIVAKITSDSNGVRTFYMTMFSIANALLNIVIVYIGLIVLEPMLGVIILALVPIIVFWITVYRKKVHRYYLDLRETGSRITGKLNELITGALIIQDFNQEEEMMDEYKALVNRYNYNDKKSQYDQHLFRLGIADCVKTADRSSHLILFGLSGGGSGGCFGNGRVDFHFFRVFGPNDQSDQCHFQQFERVGRFVGCRQSRIYVYR